MDLCELLVFTMLWKMLSGLRCYQCEPQYMTHLRENLCEHFDYSDKYLVECNHSTMCYKRETMSPFGNGVKLYERGCARQILNGDQERTSQGWRQVKKIYEVYEEGCKDILANVDRVTKTVDCYCRGDLCNGSRDVKSGAVILLTLGLLILRY